MSRNPEIFDGAKAACVFSGILMSVLFTVLAVRLKAIQLESSANAADSMRSQSTRRVQTEAPRGRILDRNGTVLACNRKSFSITVDAMPYRRKTSQETVAAMAAAITNAGAVAGLEVSATPREIERHVRCNLARPFVAWRDVDARTVARISEHSCELAGFSVEEGAERYYPLGDTAFHLVGYVGRDTPSPDSGDEKFNFSDKEMRGRSGLEYYYDAYLKGVPGEKDVTVDARGFARGERTVVEAKSGVDLVLNLDVSIQKAAQSALEGCTGACVVMDPRDGAVLAAASSPRCDLNAFVPVLYKSRYEIWRGDPAKPLLDRAFAGVYAPGSTFKPLTALAAIASGADAKAKYECIGAYRMGEFKIRCSRTWGHGSMDLESALRDSCNPYFCEMGVKAGVETLSRTARAFGLGAKTGVDAPSDAAGIVPDPVWKSENRGEMWYAGDLAQMSIGQGMLVASPLQMARVACAIGTGFLVTPRCKAGLAAERRPLPFSQAGMDAVRSGMKKVVESGTGRLGAEDVAADVIGKTGTAEVGYGASRRKNAWFIAFAKGSSASRADARDAMVAVAMVVENGESGGGTAAPKVCKVLKAVFNES